MINFLNNLGSRIKPEIAYVVLALFLGTLFVFAIPSFYVQDEVNHFYRAYQLSDFHLVAKKNRGSFYMLSLPSIGDGSNPPINWTELSPMFVKDGQNNIYFFSFKDTGWKYTQLDSSLFKDVYFPAQNEPPVFLREQDKKPEIYDEIANKNALHRTALYQSGDFLPTSVVEATRDILHHLPIPPFETVNKFKISTLIALLHQELRPDIKTFAYFNNTALYAPFFYLPQICGIAIGKIFNQPATVMLYLSRLLAFLCSVVIVYYAIKVIPIMKWTMFLLALMPMTIWEQTSLSYDNLTISVSFLLCALFFWYALTKAEIKLFDLVTIFALTCLVSLSKMAYFPLIFIYFLIPKEKIGINRYLKIFFWLFFANVAAIGLWSLVVYKSYVPYVYGVYVDPWTQFCYILQHPSHIFTVISRYCSTFNLLYFRQFVGGIFESPSMFQLSLVNSYFFILFLVSFLSNEQEIQLKVRQKLLTGSLFVITFFVVCSLIYISGTEVGALDIYGMRQRYLIPFSILLFSLFQSKALSKFNLEPYKALVLPVLSFATLANFLWCVLLNISFNLTISLVVD